MTSECRTCTILVRALALVQNGRQEGGSHVPKGVPIFPGAWGPQDLTVYSPENGYPDLHIPPENGDPGPHFRESPLSHDTGYTTGRSN